MNRCAVLVRSAVAHDFNLRDLYAAAADLPVNMPVPTHLGGKFRAQCVNNGKTDTVKAAGDLITAAAEFAARMKHCECDFKRGFAGFGMNVNGNAPAVVNNGNGVVRMNGNINMSAESRHCFIDGVIDDFINKVVQAS